LPSFLAQVALAPKAAILMTALPGDDRAEALAWTRRIVAISRKRKSVLSAWRARRHPTESD